MKKEEKKSKKKDNPGALFIPAGVLLGIGLGFLYERLVAGLFIGLGTGFVIFALTEIFKKRNKN